MRVVDGKYKVFADGFLERYRVGIDGSDGRRLSSGEFWNAMGYLGR